MSHAASQSARRRLQESWSARDYGACSRILTEALPANETTSCDPVLLESLVHALRPMTAEAAGLPCTDCIEPFEAQRAALFKRAETSNNMLRMALTSDAIAVKNDILSWARTLFEYVVLRGGNIGSKRQQIWEDVAFLHWAAGHLLRYCELDELSVARLFLTVVDANAHLSWECTAPSIMKLVMQEERIKLQDGFVASLSRLAEGGKLSEPEAFLAFDLDGRLVDTLAPAISRFGLRHPNSAALAYFRVYNGTLPVDAFLAQIADVECMLLGRDTAFIVAGDVFPTRLCRSLNTVGVSQAQTIHLTWWLNVNFPREQLGDTGFIVSRVPPFVRSLLALGKATLVLAATGEASWFAPRWVGWMEKLAEALSCQPHRIAYLSQNTRFRDGYRAHRAAVGASSRFGTIPFNTHFMLEGLRAEPLPATTPTKHFLCFNQRPHVHRAALLLGMRRDGLLERSHMSFNQPIKADPSLTGAAIAPWLDVMAAEADMMIDAMEPDLPLRLDLSGQGVTTAIDAGYVDHFSAALFADSALYIVTETEMDGPAMCRFTEKTLKGLAAEIPFIVFGSVGVLASLRALGFRTFAPLIDESYDAIEEPVARFHAAYAEVRRLAAMPLETLVGLREMLQPVLRHNRATLLEIGGRLNQRLAEDLESAMVGA